MGQYQQWLHYRDVDRLLHVQLDELEEELAQLRNREQLLQNAMRPLQFIHTQEQHPVEETTLLLQADNEILHALAIGLNGHTNHAAQAEQANQIEHTEHTSARNGAAESVPIQPSQPDEPINAISQALFAQSSLTPAEEQYATDPVATPNSFQPPHNSNMTLPSIPHSPHSEPVLLPEDMDAFIDGHTPTEPRVELPDWLRNAALHNANGPIDQESVRTNRLIQRWIERWGRHPGTQELSEEDTPL